MDLNKASEVYNFYLEEIEKAKYIKRTGSPGNWKYEYPKESKSKSAKKEVEIKQKLSDKEKLKIAYSKIENSLVDYAEKVFGKDISDDIYMDYGPGGQNIEATIWKDEKRYDITIDPDYTINVDYDSKKIVGVDVSDVKNIGQGMKNAFSVISNVNKGSKAPMQHPAKFSV